VSSDGALKGVIGDHWRSEMTQREGRDCLLDARLSCLELIKLLFRAL
jgi:hypothetical protein